MSTRITVRIDELFDRTALDAALAEGYVREQTHPGLPLSIFNYTEKAAYERAWTPVTRICRGLIVDNRTGEIVARPFPKFFNHGEPESAALDLTGRVAVTDKADGSLGITYSTPGGLSIATRGSFSSDQAVHATILLRDRYPDWKPLDGCTALFEIVYPSNRIVVDYGSMDDLILLGYVHIATGRSIAPERGWGWPGPVIDSFAYDTFTEALAAEPRTGKEGLVVHLLDSDQRVKIKQADYVMMHRVVTGFTARRLWERAAVHATFAAHPDMPVKRIAQQLRLSPADTEGILAAGPGWLEALRATAPEEFVAWIDATVTGLHEQVRPIISDALDVAGRLSALPRPQAAAQVVDHPRPGLVFAALDGKPITAQAWAAIYPAHEKPFWTRGEDAA